MTISAAVSDGRGTVREGAGGVGTRIINRNYPCVEGLSAAITLQTGSPNL